MADEAKPPLGLSVELVLANGSTKRLDSQAPEPGDRPTGISFRTQRYTGFADATCSLPRRIDLDYGDIALLNGFNLIGEDGSVAYEGRIASAPRSLSERPSVAIQAQGWMSAMKDEPFVQVFVDRDLSKWVGPSTQRILDLLAGNYSPGMSQLSVAPDENGQPAVVTGWTGSWASPNKPISEAWWLPVPGVKLGAIWIYIEHEQNVGYGDPNWQIYAGLTQNDRVGATKLSGNLNTAPAHAGYIELDTSQYTAAILQMYYAGTPSGAVDGTNYRVWWQRLAVYGDHGLQVDNFAAANPEFQPGGFFVSTMLRHIVDNYVPELDSSGIQDTSFAVPHASFTSETLPYDAFQTLNAYHRWEIAVYEGKKVLYYPIDLNDWDWEIRAGDPGTSVNLQGDDVANLCNGVIVRFTNLLTGYEERITPEESTALKDSDPNNPANQHGLKLWTQLSLSSPVTPEAAEQMGRAYLAEFNRAQSPGSITVSGHVRDRAGHWQPGWKVRAGDRIMVTDLPNESVRIVGETTWNHDAKQLEIGVDTTFKRLDAVLARMSNALEANNLSLPGPV